VSAELEGYLARLDVLQPDLRRAASAGAAPGALTEPDPGGEERWDAGQVWAHLAEFVPYWIAEASAVADPAAPEPVPFGRVKTDPGRIAAIEERRAEPVGVLAGKVAGDVEALRRFLQDLDGQPGAWARRGVHSRLGEMPLTAIVEEFLVGHVEEHLRQLEGLFPGD
jgi:hypothetical protein